MLDHICFILREALRTMAGTVCIWPLNEWLLNKIFSLAWKFIVG